MNTIPLYDEKELFRLIADGDQLAFRRIFDLYKEKLFIFILRMTKSESVAEELVQDIFMKLWISRSSLAKVENPGSYIYMMARNRTLDHLRKISLESKLIGQVWNRIVEFQNSTELEIDLNESKKLVQEAITQLTPQQQKIFRLSRFDGLKLEEIADQLGISKSTAKNHLVDALRSVKDHLRRHSGILAILFIMAFPD